MAVIFLSFIFYLFTFVSSFYSLCVFYLFPMLYLFSIFNMFMRWAGHVARMGEVRGAYNILVGRPEGRHH
jgi:hypothetical protein